MQKLHWFMQPTRHELYRRRVLNFVSKTCLFPRIKKNKSEIKYLTYSICSHIASLPSTDHHLSNLTQQTLVHTHFFIHFTRHPATFNITNMIQINLLEDCIIFTFCKSLAIVSDVLFVSLIK